MRKHQTLNEINESEKVNEEQIYNKWKRIVVIKYNGIRRQSMMNCMLTRGVILSHILFQKGNEHTDSMINLNSLKKNLVCESRLPCLPYAH